MSSSLLKAAQVTRVMNAVAAGTSVQNGTVLDMQGFESVQFIAMFGTLTATQVTSLKVQGGTKSDGSDMTDLAGTSTGPMADADSNKTLITEIVRATPAFRYIRCVVVRGTANAVIDGVVAIQYKSHKPPETQGSTNSANKSVVEPAAGTA